MLYGLTKHDKPIHGISLPVFKALAVRPLSTRELLQVEEVKARFPANNSLANRLTVLRRERQIEQAYFGPLKIAPARDNYNPTPGKPKGRDPTNWKWYLTDFGWLSYTRATDIQRPTHEDIWKQHIKMGRHYNYTENRPREKEYTEEEIQAARERLEAFQALKESERARRQETNGDNQEPEF